MGAAAAGAITGHAATAGAPGRYPDPGGCDPSTISWPSRMAVVVSRSSSIGPVGSSSVDQLRSRATVVPSRTRSTPPRISPGWRRRVATAASKMSPAVASPASALARSRSSSRRRSSITRRVVSMAAQNTPSIGALPAGPKEKVK